MNAIYGLQEDEQRNSAILADVGLAWGETNGYYLIANKLIASSQNDSQ